MAGSRCTRTILAGTPETTGARTPMGKVTEMPLDRLDKMFSEAPTRYSPSLDPKLEPSTSPSNGNTHGTKGEAPDPWNSNPKLQKKEKPE